MSERYNGWANYETWRVNLEYFDGDDFERFEDYVQELYEEYEPACWAPLETPEKDRDMHVRIKLGEMFKDEVEEYVHTQISDEGGGQVLQGWVMVFISAVRWTEIAGHAIDAIKERIEIPELIEA